MFDMGRDKNQLRQSVDAVFSEVYPLLSEIEDRIGAPIADILWINLSRKLATRGVPLEKLQKDLATHYKHQVSHNEKNKTHH
jgi:hypothetical protein